MKIISDNIAKRWCVKKQVLQDDKSPNRLRVVLFGILDQPTEIVKDVLACGHPGRVVLVIRENTDVLVFEPNAKEERFHHCSIVHTSYKIMQLEYY